MRKHRDREWWAPSYFLEIFGGVVFLLFCKLIGLDLSSRLGGWLGQKLGPHLGGRDKKARQNIRRAMPELSEEEIDTIIKKMWCNVGRALAEYAHIKKFSQPKHSWRMELAVSPKVLQAIKERQGKVFFFSAHFTNWEVMPLVTNSLEIKMVELYQKLNNPYINNWVKNLRQKYVCPNQLEKRDALRGILHYVKTNHSFAVLVDQKMIGSPWAWFFHQPAETSEFPAVLALKKNYALVPGKIERIDEKGKTKFRITLNDPLEINRPTKTQKDVEYISQQINYCLEVMIREQPENWLWMHNRWPVPGPHKRRGRNLLHQLARA